MYSPDDISFKKIYSTLYDQNEVAVLLMVQSEYVYNERYVIHCNNYTDRIRFYNCKRIEEWYCS